MRFKEHNFIGAAVAINPQTGAVLAMASAPTFDPDKFATGISSQDWEPLNKSQSHPLINRAMDAMYPPGSTFKPVVACAGLETGAITTHSAVYCPGSYHLGRARFGCWETHGETDFTKAIAQSCDVFFYMAGQKIGPDRMSYYAKQFGLAEKTGIDLASEDIGSIPSPAWKAKRFHKLGPAFDQWFGGDTLHMAIGQGDVLTTPLQMARVAATLANGGDVLQPYVVQKVTDGDTGGLLYQSQPTIVRHVPVSPANIEAVRRAMRPRRHREPAKWSISRRWPSPPRLARRRRTAMPRRTAYLSALRLIITRPLPLPRLWSMAGMAATRQAKSPAPCCKRIFI